MAVVQDVIGTLWHATEDGDPELHWPVLVPSAETVICLGWVLAIGQLSTTEHGLRVISAHTIDGVTHQLLDLGHGAVCVDHESTLGDDSPFPRDAPIGEWWYLGLRLHHDAIWRTLEHLQQLDNALQLYWVLDTQQWRYLYIHNEAADDAE